MGVKKEPDMNKARRQRRVAGRVAASKRDAAGTAKDIRSKKVSLVQRQPIWSKTRETNAPHCGTYHAGRRQMTMTVEDIGPPKALEYLGKSKGNRRLNQHAVNRYAADMLREKWVLSPQGISFDTNGVLIDGHTRLNAIIKSGKTVKITVFRNVPPETVAFLDYGKNRVGKDILAREGVAASSKVMSMTKAAILGWNSRPSGDVSEDQQVTVAMENLADIEWILEELGRGQRAPVAGAVLRAVVNEGQTERLRKFCNSLRDTTNEGKKCPVNVLLRYITKVKAKTASGTHNDLYPRVVTAIVKFLAEENMTQLAPAKGDIWPFDID